MRWVASLFALGLMMALFHRLTAASPVAARSALALGFLLVTAWPASEIARRARVPRITGLLLLGLCVGPAWLNLVRADEVRALAFVGDACVALIAFAAGSAVPLATLRAERVALARLAGGTIVFPFAAVALVTLSVSRWFPLTVHQPLGNALGVALTLGAIAAASSPVVTMALMDELHARGPLARAVLGVTVVKDVALIALLALVLVVARLVGSAGAVHVGVGALALARLAGSLAIGAVVGALAAQYLKLARRDTALVLVTLAFAPALAARVLHVEALLVALAAGIYLGSVSREESERLRVQLARAALPVYAAMFLLAGAGFRLEALADLWPWVLLLAGLRAVALRYGTLWAGRSAVVTPALAREAWLGLISQAGTVLGLAAVARQAFPAWGVSLEALVVAMVAVYEAVGPICFRHGLARAGEFFKEEAHAGEQPVTRGALGGGTGGGLHKSADRSGPGRLPFGGAAGLAERGTVRGDRPRAHGRVRDVPCQRIEHRSGGVSPGAAGDRGDSRL
ncbi:MAG: hypothetical protein AUH42_00045 [Gemmatimonadetes bacterium 13_1_40CM_70_11]|nr:MAG: hypothetical protein AUH42_00045 [Gemmatimonadetes bacterium 13_1_40CM_70_11]